MVRSAGFFVAFLAMVAATVTCRAQDPTINPAKGYDVKSYNATIWLNRQKDSISGWVEMSAVAMGGLPQILQHVKFLQIDSVFVDGKRATITSADSSGAYDITGYPNTYQSGSYFTTKTYYHGKGTNEGGSYAWGGVQNMGNMMFAMGVGFSAPYVSCTRHWLPCYDEPDDKADSVTLNFYADTSGIVVSNGLQTDHRAGTDNGTTNYFQWKISHPIATYLLTFAFGPFEKLSIANPLHIPFDVYAFAADTVATRTLMEKRVVPALVFFDSLYGKYPFEKVGYVIAPIGSMEHQTMITLDRHVLDPHLDSTTAVHELSHHWWGDRTTCYDFNDPWLNEGFARFSESLYLERFWGESEYWRRQHSNISGAISGGSTIPLYGAPFHTAPRNNYPFPVIYQKGASVLGMLRYELGDSLFFDALRTYGFITKYSTATSQDLENIIADTTHEDLRMFFIEWVYGIGIPQLTVNWSKNGNTINLRLTQNQDSAKIGFFRHPIIVETRSLSLGKTERHEILLDTMRVTGASFVNSFIPDTIVIDPDGVVLKKMTGGAKLGVIDRQNTNQPQELRFMPNPTEQHSMLAVYQLMPNGISLQDALIEIFSSNGNRVSLQKLDSPLIEYHSSTARYFFDTSTLPSGTYFASLMLNNRQVAKGQFAITK